MNTSHRTRFWNFLLTVILLLSLALTSCSTGEETDVPQDEIETAPAQVEPQGEAGTWLVMLYQDADDEVLEQDIFIDLNEAELVGSTEYVTIIAQLDRLDGGFDGGGDETTAKRYLITQDDDLENIASEELEDLGEINMGDMDTLVDFAVWAIESYPADNYVLILSDHGGGWTGGWSDNDPVQGGGLSMEQIDLALGEIIEQTGIGQFEMLGFDACLMAQVESLTAIAPHARYAVASEETEPSLGWAYASFLEPLTQNPGMDGAGLSRAIVESYITQDFRLVDDEARRSFLGGDYSTEAAVEYMAKDITLTAVDLSQMSALNQALNDLAAALASDDPAVAAAARAYAQSYKDVFGKKEAPAFIDLGHFAALAAEESDDEAVVAAAQALLDQVQAAVVAERHGDQRPGSTGFSIYFPNSDLYGLTLTGASSLDYTSSVSRFAAASLWDDFLTAYYTGGEVDPDSADLSVLEPAFPSEELAALADRSKPAADVTPVSPVAGSITVEPLEISAEEIPTDGVVTINTTVSGSNVAYIYIYTIFYNEEDDSYLTADIDFITADSVKEVGGVTYPDWGDGEIPIELDWEPTVYFLSDGNEENDQFALFEPEVYGAASEDDVYTVYGLYAFGGSGEPLEAMLQFDGNGDMRSAWVFSGDEQAGRPRQVTPEPGDTFTIWDEWMEYDEAGQDWVYNYYEGGTITFGETPLTMVPYYAFPGVYEIGIVAVDFDGNLVEEYAEVIVSE